MFNAEPINALAAKKHAEAIKEMIGSERGPFYGVDSANETFSFSKFFQERSGQETHKIILRESDKLTIKDKEGVYENKSTNPPTEEKTISGPAVAKVTVKEGSNYSLSANGVISSILYRSSFTKQPPILVDQQETLTQEKLEEMSSEHPIWMGCDFTGDERLGEMTRAYAALIDQKYRQAEQEGRKIGSPDADEQNFGETVRTYRNLKSSEHNNPTHYLMSFGLTWRSIRDYANFPYDNFFHIHPRSRVERHLTDGANYEAIMGTKPIQNADADVDQNPMACLKVFDPVFSNDFYVHFVAPNSCHSLYLPARTPHKFKVCLDPEVYDFCNEAAPILMAKGLIPNDVVEQSHAAAHFFKTNGKINDNSLDKIFAKYGGTEAIMKKVSQTCGSIMETLHEYEPQEIGQEAEKEGVRSTYETSIAQQTVALEPERTMSEAAMQILIKAYKDIAKTEAFAKGGPISLPAEVQEAFAKQLVADHEKFVKLEKEVFSSKTNDTTWSERLSQADNDAVHQR